MYNVTDKQVDHSSLFFIEKREEFLLAGTMEIGGGYQLALFDGPYYDIGPHVLMFMLIWTVYFVGLILMGILNDWV